jgi:hypothetical protein
MDKPANSQNQNIALLNSLMNGFTEFEPTVVPELKLDELKLEPKI